MPVEFLSDEQVAVYGRFVGDPDRPELERFCFLDDVDHELVAMRRGDHNRLGFAVQLGTVRSLGTFLSDPLEVPWRVVDYLAAQLDIADPSVVKRYTERSKTAYEHAWEIREAFGFRDFSDEQAAAGLREFMDGRAWVHSEGPHALFEQAVAWLRRHRVLLPGVSVLARLVLSVREAAADRLYRTLAEAAHDADPALSQRLVQLLGVGDGQRVSELELLRRVPRRTSGRAMTEALDRVSTVLEVGAGAAQIQGTPVSRIAALARYGMTAKSPAIKELAEPRRTATLLAAVCQLEATAVDDALDLFDLLMATRLIAAARRTSAANRAAVMPKLEKASVTLAGTARVLLEVLADAGDVVDVAEAWAAVERVAPRERVLDAVAVVEELVPVVDGSAEAAMREALAERYLVVRPFLELLAEALPLKATPAAQPLLREVGRLPELARRRVSQKPLLLGDIDEDLVPAVWRPAVYTSGRQAAGAVDRDAYVLCVLERLHGALRRRDVFASPSQRWADPRAQLLAGAEWLAVRDDVLAGLGLAEPVEAHLADLTETLHTAWRLLAQRLDEAGPDASVRIVPAGADGRVQLSVERLQAVGEPESLTQLRATVAAMLPRIDLPDLLLEVHGWTGYLDAYTHIGELHSRMDDLPTTLAGLLVAEACNVGLTPVIAEHNPALTRDRLSHVDQNYVRAATHAAANARLIDAQAGIAVAQQWGGGMLASVDGLRFVVPVQTINAAPSPRYFGLKRGVTWLNAVNDQVAGIGAVVVTGTLRDSLHILDTILTLDGGQRPEMIATDTASYSDIVFGLFRMLGYRFSPRIADMSDQRFWRADVPGAPGADYGPLNAIARHKVNLAKIQAHWPDMLRVAGSLLTNTVRAYDLIRMLGRDGSPTPLGQAFAEYGRIPKTLHMLAMVDPIDTGYRRTVQRQLNVQESRHRLGRKIFHGQRGELRQPYREGQEDQLGALGISRSESPSGTCVLRDLVLAPERYPTGVRYVRYVRPDDQQVQGRARGVRPRRVGVVGGGGRGRLRPACGGGGVPGRAAGDGPVAQYRAGVRRPGGAVPVVRR